MLEGLAQAGTSVIALSSVPITRSNCPKRVISLPPDCENGVDYHYLRVLNWRIVRNIATLSLSFAETCRHLRSNKEAAVICDVLNFSASTGALIAAKIFRRANIGIVTDIPGLLSRSPNPLISRIIHFAMKRYDAYVFLTKEMDSLVNQRHVPSVVIEGLVDINMKDKSNDLANKHSERVCLYAGAIEKRYGLESLVEGFMRADSQNCELHVYGAGDYERDLTVAAQRESRVKYLGTVPNDHVVEEQLRATLLLNPRPTSEAFTKYSFPSKNMEYMASGTPMLTTLLPGMPEEYLPHVYVLQDESPEGIAAALDRVLALDDEELYQKGRSAKEFVLAKKNNVLQAGRVIQLLAECQRSRIDSQPRGSNDA